MPKKRGIDMSTRCNVVVKDKYNEIWFYRHSDGYPEGALPTLKQFMSWVGVKIRRNVEQAAGWLILIGATEYNNLIPEPFNNEWKVGAYEPSCGQHGDIEYLYTLDLDELTITVDNLSGTVYTVTDFTEGVAPVMGGNDVELMAQGRAKVDKAIAE